MRRSGAAIVRGLVLAVLVAAALAAGLRRAAAPARPAPGGAVGAPWDLLALVRDDPNRPPDHLLTLASPFDETRTALRTPIPDRFDYPVVIPADAVLDFAYAVRPIVFLTYQPALAEPTRFRVVFTDAGGAAHVLLDQVVDVRGRESDRRWFDARLDLRPYAGQAGRLGFSVALDAEPERQAPVTALFATPRLVRPAAPGDVSLLLVTVDCLRADHVGAYGYGRPTTPMLDRLAAEGVRYARAYSTAPMTLPSIPQLFSGALFPAPGQPSLVDPIAAAGIPSAAIINNVWIWFWLTSGRDGRRADTFDTIVSGELDAHAITDRAIRWLEQRRDDRFALYLHYLDAHTPYGAPPSYARLFADPAYRGPIRDRFDDVDGANAGRYDAADRARIVGLYDGAIRYVDTELGRLLEYLRRDGRLDRTLVVVTADHGEELWDHDRFFHGQSLYDELLHVPLLVRLPGAARAGTVVERRVRSIDVAPSLLAWAGLPQPASFEGRRLDEDGAGDADPDGAADLVATATIAQFPLRYAIRTASHKLIESLDTGTFALFDLVRDPDERHDRLAEEPELARALGERLFAARARLRQRGLAATVSGPAAGRAHVRLRLEGPPEHGVFQTVDRSGAPAPGMRLTTTTDGARLELEGDVDAGGFAFRFDRWVKPLTGSGDLLRVALEVDGAPAAEGAVRLGGAGTAAGDGFDALAPELVAEAAPPCAPPERGVRVCLWRHADTADAAPAPGPDEAARRRLRALGYVQ